MDMNEIDAKQDGLFIFVSIVGIMLFIALLMKAAERHKEKDHEGMLTALFFAFLIFKTSAEKVKEILIHRAEAVLSASVETAQLGLQDVTPINLELHPKSGLSKKSSKKLAKVG